MNQNDRLWRVFQSRLQKSLNKLPLAEQKRYRRILSLEQTVTGQFDFDEIEKKFHATIAGEKRKRKLTKSKRAEIARKESEFQITILEDSAIAFSKGVFDMRELALTNVAKVISMLKEKLENVNSKGCEFYPCQRRDEKT